MIFALDSQFHVYLQWVNTCLACLNSGLNVKALVGVFNQENALVGAFSDGSFAALFTTLLQRADSVHRVPVLGGGGGRGRGGVGGLHQDSGQPRHRARPRTHSLQHLRPIQVTTLIMSFRISTISTISKISKYLHIYMVSGAAAASA